MILSSKKKKKKDAEGGGGGIVKLSASCCRPPLRPFATTCYAPDKVSVPEDVSSALCRPRESLAAAKGSTAAEARQHGLNVVDAQGGAVMIAGASTAAEFHLTGVQQSVAQLMHVDLAAVVVVEGGEGREKFRRRG